MKAATHSYDDPVDLLIELTMQREIGSHTDNYLHKHLPRESPAQKKPGRRSPNPTLTLRTAVVGT